MKWNQKLSFVLHRAISQAMNAVAQGNGTAASTGSGSASPAMQKLARQAAAEGAVLLKNENQVLPFPKGAVLSVYGRVQIDTFFAGYGSGGEVHAPYQINILEGLRQNEDLLVNESLAAVYEAWTAKNPPDPGYWGHWPMSHTEMPLDSGRAEKDSRNSDAAVVVIGRAAGEDRENTLTAGSYYIKKDELALLREVTAHFKKVVVLLNCGSPMDLSWLESFGDRIQAVLCLWQCGMETGGAAADLLSGKVSPSGRLSDTIARSYADYPSARHFGNKAYNNYTEDIFVGYRFFETFAKDRVLFPFAHGLSYTTFSRKVTRTSVSGNDVRVWVQICNTGTFSGSDAVTLFLQKPQGMLSQSTRELAAFEKTRVLCPGEEDKLCLQFSLCDLASYDDKGLTGYPYAFVLERGTYRLFLGGSAREAEEIRTFELLRTCLVKQCKQACAPDGRHPFERTVARKDKNGALVPMTERAPTMKVDLKGRILKHLPADLPQTGDRGLRLCDVAKGTATLEDFTAQLSFDELEAISRGAYCMGSELGTPGNAGVLGGVLPSLREKGVPPLTTTDGPCGLRLAAVCSQIPNGVSLACSFNKKLVEALLGELAKEMEDRGSQIILAPGMNIHRNPLCGRNFEYFSEDPHLSGKIAASYVRGVQSCSRSACPKHFACNNQETNRTHNDSRVSERALREIYLKGFEICVKEANPKNIMTSYNKINGVWSHYNYDLCETILRGEWGYQGNVMTDWWMRSEVSHEFPGVVDQGYRVRSRVDVLMPGGARTGKHEPDGSLKKSAKAKQGVTFGEMQRCAMDVLGMILQVYSAEELEKV